MKFYLGNRFDDTNPEAEKKEYIDHIQENVQRMGWELYKVTYTSDYFQDLYELAFCLIQKGLAYVDHQFFFDLLAFGSIVTTIMHIFVFKIMIALLWIESFLGNN